MSAYKTRRVEHPADSNRFIVVSSFCPFVEDDRKRATECTDGRGDQEGKAKAACAIAYMFMVVVLICTFLCVQVVDLGTCAKGGQKEEGHLGQEKEDTRVRATSNKPSPPRELK
jgi:hypothetical protein